MPKKSNGRNDQAIVEGLAKANALIADLASRDDVDTRSYGFMVRRAGQSSLAIHRGLHPSEQDPADVGDRRDVRLPRAQMGLSVGGSLKMDLVEQIRLRHEELTRLHRWTVGLNACSPRAADFSWDPVLLGLLEARGVDLDWLVAEGPGTFADASAARSHPEVGRIRTVLPVYASDAAECIGVVDGDAVRALHIHYGPGMSYRWRREQPAHVELVLRDRRLPEGVLRNIAGSQMSAIVGHASLACMDVQGYAAVGSTMSFKSPARLVRM